jgi:hypothetical protein
MTTKKNIQYKKNTRKNIKKTTYKKKGGSAPEKRSTISRIFDGFFGKTKTPLEKKTECIDKCNADYEKAMKAQQPATPSAQPPTLPSAQPPTPPSAQPPTLPSAQPPTLPSAQPPTLTTTPTQSSRESDKPPFGGKKQKKKRTNKYKKNENLNPLL